MYSVYTEPTYYSWLQNSGRITDVNFPVVNWTMIKKKKAFLLVDSL